MEQPPPTACLSSLSHTSLTHTSTDLDMQTRVHLHLSPCTEAQTHTSSISGEKRSVGNWKHINNIMQLQEPGCVRLLCSLFNLGGPDSAPVHTGVTPWLWGIRLRAPEINKKQLDTLPREGNSEAATHQLPITTTSTGLKLTRQTGKLRHGAGKGAGSQHSRERSPGDTPRG